MKAIFLPLLFCAALAAQPASIEGTVVNDSDGQPVPATHVALVSNDLEQGYGAVSDRTGHFSIVGIPPGSYLLMPEHTGFLYAQKPTDPPVPTVQLKAGQQLTGFTLKMAPRAVIAGRVLDENGDPVSSVSVQASFAPDQPFVSLLRGSPFGTTDDRGMFRMVVPPGKYYLKAMPQNMVSGESPEIRTDGSAEAIYSATFYPSAAGADGAAPVEAAAGRDVTGMDIRLVRLRSLNLSGVVTGGASATVFLRSKNTNRAVGVGPDGRFAFNRLEPGAYQIYAESAAKPQLQSQVLTTRLAGADQNNVQLLLTPGGDLSGKVELAGAPLTGRHTIHLDPIGQPAGSPGGISGGGVEAGGAFDLTGVSPGRYRIAIDLLPEGAYIKTVALDGVAARNNSVDLTHGVHAAKLKITIGADGGRLSGVVHDSSGAPAAGPWGMVLLVPDADPSDPDISRLTPDGKYSFQGIRPGKYRVSAIDMMSFSSAIEGAFKEVAARGEVIEIAEGSKLNKDLKLLSKEAGNAKN